MLKPENQTAVKESYNIFSSQAAKAERDGDYTKANSLWNKARNTATKFNCTTQRDKRNKDAKLNWCAARALVCVKKLNNSDQFVI